MRPGQRLTNHTVVRVNKEREGLAEVPPSELLLRDGDSVSGGGVLPARQTLQQVPHIDQDSSRDGVRAHPVPLNILHLKTSKLVLEEKRDGPVVRVFPAAFNQNTESFSLKSPKIFLPNNSRLSGQTVRYGRVVDRPEGGGVLNTPSLALRQHSLVDVLQISDCLQEGVLEPSILYVLAEVSSHVRIGGKHLSDHLCEILVET